MCRLCLGGRVTSFICHCRVYDFHSSTCWLIVGYASRLSKVSRLRTENTLSGFSTSSKFTSKASMTSGEHFSYEFEIVFFDGFSRAFLHGIDHHFRHPIR